ncbi:hypothetical protein [Nocardia crassostreae]|uniref:hypothetical protein n=1 Tax=Nocardia crassostreae TaxID=53428 RepID=UPI00082E1B64|nr:hypothetical protein [Nocardia crassostreae]
MDGADPGLEIRVVLLDGFADDDVVVTVGDDRRTVRGVTTKLLTGLAEQLVFAAVGETRVRVEVAARGAEDQRMVRGGRTLLVSISGSALKVVEVDGAPGFG